MKLSLPFSAKRFTGLHGLGRAAYAARCPPDLEAGRAALKEE
jgi:hypothetical protein